MSSVRCYNGSRDDSNLIVCSGYWPGHCGHNTRVDSSTINTGRGRERSGLSDNNLNKEGIKIFLNTRSDKFSFQFFQVVTEDRIRHWPKYPALTFPLWRAEWAVKVLTFPLIFDPTHHLNCYKCDIREYFDIENLNIVHVFIRLSLTMYFISLDKYLLLFCIVQFSYLILRLRKEIAYILSWDPPIPISAPSLPVKTRSRQVRLRR